MNEHPQPHSHQPVSAFALLKPSKEIVKRNLKLFAILYALPFLGNLFGSLQSIGAGGDNTTFGPGISSPDFSGIRIAAVLGGSFIVVLTVLAITAIYQTLLFCFEVEAAKGHQPTLKHLWQSTKKYWLRIVGLTLTIGFILGLPLLAVLVVVFIVGAISISVANNVGLGLAILLFVPYVIYFVHMIRRYFLSPYVLIDKDLSIKEAMQKSDQLSKPHPRAIWGIIGVIILLSLPGVIPVIGGLVSFVLGALYSFAAALRYEELKKLT